jgi:hypothetical protein
MAVIHTATYDGDYLNAEQQAALYAAAQADLAAFAEPAPDAEADAELDGGAELEAGL